MTGLYVLTYASCKDDDNPQLLDGTIFESRESAESWLRRYYSNTDLYAVIPAPWRLRENYRFSQYSDPYLQPVWKNEKFWQESRQMHREHFVHISAKDPRLLAYTENDDKGKRDIQTPIKPGKYLSKFFGDVLTPKQIAFYAEWHATGSRPSTLTDVSLHFATTADEIEEVYTKGPRSCMSGKHFKIHPSRAYAAGDLAVAYVRRGVDDRIIARALCWPEKKGFGRCYPNTCSYTEDGFSSVAEAEEAQTWIFNELRRQGYKSEREEKGVLEGARIARITHHGDVVMPYIDNDYGVSEKDDAFVLTKDYDYAADNTNGYLGYAVEDESEYTCEYCDAGCDEVYDVYGAWSATRGAHSHSSYCYSCRDSETFYCEGTGYYFTCDSVEVEGSTYVPGYADQVSFVSAISGERYLNRNGRILPDGRQVHIDEELEAA